MKLLLFTVSYQNTLLKPKNPTQGHMTSYHKDVRGAPKTSSYATKVSIMPQRHQLCHKDISFAMKTSVMPQRHQICHKDISYVTKTSIMLQRHQICHKDISYATMTSICHKDGVPRY